MQQIKLALVILIVALVLAPLGYIGYLEFFVIPDLIFPKFGQIAILVHVLGVLFLAAVYGEVRAWIAEKKLFSVHKEMSQPLMNVAERLINGRWATDSNTYSRLIDTGARIGFAVGKVTQQAEIDRNLLENSIKGMALPAPKEATGQPIDVVAEMRSYMDDLDDRKDRLS